MIVVAETRVASAFISSVANPSPPSAQRRLSHPLLLSLHHLGGRVPLIEGAGVFGMALYTLHVSFVCDWETIGGTRTLLTFPDATRSSSNFLLLLLSLSSPSLVLVPWDTPPFVRDLVIPATGTLLFRWFLWKSSQQPAPNAQADLRIKATSLLQQEEG